MACSLARTWGIIGEPWTPLILRDLALGLRRFEDIRADLGIARNVLADRLQTLAQAGIVERQQYESANRPRFEYVLSKKGKELVPIIMAITQWGDRWTTDGAEPPVVFHHQGCGERSTAQIVCDSCGEELRADDLQLLAGPGSKTGPGTFLADMLPRTVE